MIRIDSHQHFWNYDPVKHSWITEEMKVLKNDFLPADLAPILEASDIDGCVAVQADQAEDETDFLLELSAQHDFILGVVGWIDLRAEDLERQLERYRGYEKLKGWRHIVQSEPDDNFMLRDEFLKGINLLSKFDHTYDILIFPKQLPAALELVKMFPNQKFVIDHIAKPKIAEKEIGEWGDLMSQLGALRNTWCKVSGMVTEANWSEWQQSHFDPYLKVVFDSFEVDRIMYGSDWPVCTVAAPYDEVVNIPTAFLKNSNISEQSKFWGQNAIEFYNLNILDNSSN